jgi:hypothetical protein
MSASDKLIHINHRISWNVIEILQESAIFSNFIQLLMSIFEQNHHKLKI